MFQMNPYMKKTNRYVYQGIGKLMNTNDGLKVTILPHMKTIINILKK